MALFNLDIDRYYNSQKVVGCEVKSIAHIQYPIYCVHATIIDSTPDPLEKLDKAIAHCISRIKDVSSLDIAQILSVQKRGIDIRIQKMLSEQLITGKKKYKITEFGHEVLISGKAQRLQRKPYNFYIDGIDFKPLPSELYSSRYLQSYFNENDYTHYTNSKGITKTYKPFRPNIVHEPFVKKNVLTNILEIDELERENYSIPLGLIDIENIDFTKMTIPILVGLLVKENKPRRELIDGFNSTGDSEKINSFIPKIKEKIENLELRLNTWKSFESDEEKFSFATNWEEIDKNIEDNRLQFIARDDLKGALSKLYRINFSSDEELINTDNEIGINVTEELLLSARSNRRQFLKNLERGRDYQMTSVRNGVWIVYFSFRTESSYVRTVLEIKKTLDDLRNDGFGLEQIEKALLNYSIYRRALVLLEEYDLLEQIDIRQHMQIESA